MLQLFVIFPSEAVLLGLAVGEFAELRKLGIDDSFEQVLHRRIHPFVPDLTVAVKTPIPTPDWLDAISWYDTEDAGGDAFGTLDPEEERGDHIFFAPRPRDDSSADEVREYERKVARYNEAIPKLRTWLREQHSPDTIIEFARIGGEYYRIDKDESKESLLDLLIKYLTENDPKPRKRWNERDSLRERYRVVEPGPQARHRTLADVSQRISALAKSNNLLEYFELGKVLGGAFAACVAAEQLLQRVENAYAASIDDEGERAHPSADPDQVPSPEQQTKKSDQSWRLFLNAIKADPVFKRLELASCGFLDRLAGFKTAIGHGYFGFREDQDPSYSKTNVLADAFCMRTSLSVILGYVLGDLRHADAEAIARNRDSACPRHFAKSDPVRNLALLTSIRRQGEQLLELCKQVWPNTLQGQILQRVDRSRGEASLYERDFAKRASRVLQIYQAALEPASELNFRLFEDDEHFRTLMPELRSLCRRVIDERNRNGRELSELIEDGESKHVEFKSTARWNLRANKLDPVIEREVITTIGGFLNSEGGNLLIGVDDQGKIHGLADDFKTLGKRQDRDGFEAWLMNKAITASYGNAASQFVHMRFHNVGGSDVCQVTVDAAPRPCYLRDGRAAELCIRRGNSTVSLDVEQAEAYCRVHWKRTT